MGSSMSMDVKQLEAALEILQHISSDLHGPTGGGKPIADLADTAKLPEDLKGFAVNSGSASSWIANCCSSLQEYINTLVGQLETASSFIGNQMKNSIDAYKGGDADSSGNVNQAGAPVTGAPATGDGRG